MELRAQALHILCLTDPAVKVAQTHALQAAWQAGQVALDAVPRLTAPAGLPGRPLRPRLVDPAALPRRTPFTREGRAALLHAVAHIEFNAIALALDAVWRFEGLPPDYYADWLRVAAEEATHFGLLAAHLHTLDCGYGDHHAHDGLWAMAERTQHDLCARMALVPRTLEARGLDATPPMQARLRAAGDHAAVDILAVILRDEIGHVAVGNRWYAWACARSGADPMSHFADLARRYGAPRLKPPFNLVARSAAGFTPDELQALQADAPGSGRDTAQTVHARRSRGTSQDRP